MKPQKSSKDSHPQDWVWRISEASPLGEWVDRAAPPPTIPLANAARGPMNSLPEVTTGGWLVSSYDLLSGADVVDESADSVPMDLFDELFPDHPKAGDASAK